MAWTIHKGQEVIKKQNYKVWQSLQSRVETSS